ncbi:MAG: hypothetical protein WBB69_04385 [Anaerolineales bacterium]
MDEKRNNYQSFILRLWIEETDGKKWRFSLEDTSTGKRKGFASLEKLFGYLKEITQDEINTASQKE